MTITELVNKIHKAESEGWAEHIAAQNDQILQQQINNVLTVTDEEQLTDWLVDFCGDDATITLNYLFTFLYEAE